MDAVLDMPGPNRPSADCPEAATQLSRFRHPVAPTTAASGGSARHAQSSSVSFAISMIGMGFVIVGDVA
jgi:hypothetical protein